jgi:hypothetical protein
MDLLLQVDSFMQKWSTSNMYVSACMRWVTTNLFQVVNLRAATLKRQGFSAAD